jgi:hypothetical protein
LTSKTKLNTTKSKRVSTKVSTARSTVTGGQTFSLKNKAESGLGGDFSPAPANQGKSPLSATSTPDPRTIPSHDLYDLADAIDSDKSAGSNKKKDGITVRTYKGGGVNGNFARRPRPYSSAPPNI